MVKQRLLVVAIILTFIVGWLGVPAHADITTQSTFGAELPAQDGGIRFIGEASPNAVVTFLRDGTIIGTHLAAADSSFDQSFTSEPLGQFTYSIYDTDVLGRNSASIDISATVLPAFTTILSGYLLPTTFQTAASPIKRPQTQFITGTTRQASTVTTFWSGAKYSDSFTTQATSDANGNWSTSPAQTLHLGTYTASAVVQEPGGNQSPQTPPVNYDVLLSADLNNDNRVNLTDFSILMFYYLQSNITKPADINDDGKTNLTDLSIMLFYWTG